ncbi:MAG TPA: hypothetical protein VFL82_02910 [Thermomicrobiales bacterium]|nr:hypothetical protein [Thermomicrobiales bacterium]
MTRVLYPSLRLSANGAAALLDTAERGYHLYDLPAGNLRWDLSEEGDLAHLTLSASGDAVAWVNDDGQMVTMTGAGKTTSKLPVPAEQLVAIAVSDSGKRTPLLLSSGKLLLDGAEADLPTLDRGAILANGDCTLLAVRSANTITGADALNAFVSRGDALHPLWPDTASPTETGAIAVDGNWLIAAMAEGLRGWPLLGKAITLPGTLRDRMIFSPDGRHLLAYHAEEIIHVTGAQMRFRVFDLASEKEVRTADHQIDDRQGAQFVLDAERTLFEVRALRTGELAIQQLNPSS